MPGRNGVLLRFSACLPPALGNPNLFAPASPLLTEQMIYVWHIRALGFEPREEATRALRV